jgi:hypothetical protein
LKFSSASLCYAAERCTLKRPFSPDDHRHLVDFSRPTTARIWELLREVRDMYD